MSSPSIATIGECMIELSRDRTSLSKHYRLAYGGDSLNVALYCARWGGRADYVTAIGDDPYSAEMYEDWQRENIGVDLVQKIPNRQSGLYIIETDERGERHFTYWRDSAPARDMLTLATSPGLLKAIADHEYVYFSGITLSLFSQTALDIFYKFLVNYKRAGGIVVFDLNYRPARWQTNHRAQEVINRFMTLIDIALPSQGDASLLYGDSTDAQILERYKSFGAREIVLKCGDQGCVIWSENEMSKIPVKPVQNPVDTTAAGDGFNGGYLAARLAGHAPFEAVGFGQKTASLIVGHPGAMVPKTDWPLHYTHGAV